MTPGWAARRGGRSPDPSETYRKDSANIEKVNWNTTGAGCRFGPCFMTSLPAGGVWPGAEKGRHWGAVFSVRRERSRRMAERISLSVSGQTRPPARSRSMMRPFLAHRMPTRWAESPVSAIKPSSSERSFLLMRTEYTHLRAVQYTKQRARKVQPWVLPNAHEGRLGRQIKDGDQ